ncbi:MAG TPA: hypothetical protein ENI93_08270 [Gammaproteobacteria bacterium]|nr:hypothetical protein [Gammaproteobacteria bacterium]
MRRHIHALRVLLLMTLLVTHSAVAAYGTEASRFRLIIDQTDQTWNYDNDTSSDTRVTHLRAIWDQAFNPRLSGTLELAYLDMTQSRTLSVVPANSVGYGIGVGLYGRLVDIRALGLTLFGTVNYQSTRGENDTATVDRSWWDSQAGLQLDVPLGQAVTLVGGGGYQVVNGRETLSISGVDVSNDFEVDDPLYAFAGVDLNLGAAGFVGLRFYGGNRSGGYLTFGARF